MVVLERNISFHTLCNKKTFTTVCNVNEYTSVSLRSLCSPRSSFLCLSSCSCRFVIKSSWSLVSDRSPACGHRLMVNFISVLFRIYWIILFMILRCEIIRTLSSGQWTFLTDCTKKLHQRSVLLIWRISGFQCCLLRRAYVILFVGHSVIGIAVLF